MTAVAITPASGGRHSVRFAYDSAIVSLIKSTIPAYAPLLVRAHPLLVHRR